MCWRKARCAPSSRCARRTTSPSTSSATRRPTGRPGWPRSRGSRYTGRAEWTSSAYRAYPYDGDTYLRTGIVLPEEAADELKKHDAILLGAIGHPDVAPGILEKGILLKLRFDLDQYINLRPVKLFPGVETPIKNKGCDEIDFVVVRENTEDLYCGMGGFSHKGTKDEVAVQSSMTRSPSQIWIWPGLSRS